MKFIVSLLISFSVTTAAWASGPDVPSFNEERETVRISWPLAADAELADETEPFVQRSRQYVLDTTDTALRGGVTIDTTAPAALLRITPLEGGEAPHLDQDNLVISRGQQQWRGAEATRHFADRQALAAAGADFGRGSIALQLRPELGQGRFKLRLDHPGLKQRGRPFVVHVFEPDSPIALRAQARRDHFGAGERIAVALQLEGAGGSADARDLRGFLVSPGGERMVPLTFSDGRGGVVAEADLSGLDRAALLRDWQPGLWEVHSYYDGRVKGKKVLRDAATAIAISPATAELAGHPVAGDTLSLTVPVTAHHAGRYEVRGVLYGSDAAGRMVPAAAAQSAAWLDRGNGAIELSVEPGHIDKAISAPFEFRQIRLADQSRLARLEALTGAVPVAP